jgi:hypothetical protein
VLWLVPALAAVEALDHGTVSLVGGRRECDPQRGDLARFETTATTVSVFPNPVAQAVSGFGATAVFDPA